MLSLPGPVPALAGHVVMRCYEPITVVELLAMLAML